MASYLQKWQVLKDITVKNVSTFIFAQSKIDIKINNNSQFTDIVIIGPKSGGLGNDRELKDEDMATEYGVPGEVSGELEIMQCSIDHDSYKETLDISGVEEYTQTHHKKRRLERGKSRQKLM